MRTQLFWFDSHRISHNIYEMEKKEIMYLARCLYLQLFRY